MWDAHRLSPGSQRQLLHAGVGAAVRVDLALHVCELRKKTRQKQKNASVGQLCGLAGAARVTDDRACFRRANLHFALCWCPACSASFGFNTFMVDENAGPFVQDMTSEGSGMYVFSPQDIKYPNLLAQLSYECLSIIERPGNRIQYDPVSNGALGWTLTVFSIQYPPFQERRESYRVNSSENCKVVALATLNRAGTATYHCVVP